MSRTIVLAAFSMMIFSAPATARYIEGDPLGVVPIPEAVSNPPSAMVHMITAPRAITATDVLKFRMLNHPYVYVSNSPLKYTDPLGLQQSVPYGLPWVMAPNYDPFYDPRINNPCACPIGPGEALGGTMLAGGGIGAATGLGIGLAATAADVAASSGAIGAAGAMATAGKMTVTGGTLGLAGGAAAGLVVAGAILIRQNSCQCPCQ